MLSENLKWQYQKWPPGEEGKCWAVVKRHFIWLWTMLKSALVLLSGYSFAPLGIGSEFDILLDWFHFTTCSQLESKSKLNYHVSSTTDSGGNSYRLGGDVAALLLFSPCHAPRYSQVSWLAKTAGAHQETNLRLNRSHSPLIFSFYYYPIRFLSTLCNCAQWNAVKWGLPGVWEESLKGKSTNLRRFFYHFML